MSDLVGNPEDRFSRNIVHFMVHCNLIVGGWGGGGGGGGGGGRAGGGGGGGGGRGRGGGRGGGGVTYCVFVV